MRSHRSAGNLPSEWKRRVGLGNCWYIQNPNYDFLLKSEWKIWTPYNILQDYVIATSLILPILCTGLQPRWPSVSQTVSLLSQEGTPFPLCGMLFSQKLALRLSPLPPHPHVFLRSQLKYHLSKRTYPIIQSKVALQSLLLVTLFSSYSFSRVVLLSKLIVNFPWRLWACCWNMAAIKN